jgi:hypothetical protein
VKTRFSNEFTPPNQTLEYKYESELDEFESVYPESHCCCDASHNNGSLQTATESLIWYR